VQNCRGRPMHVRDRTPGCRHGEGPQNRQVARRNAAHHRKLRLAERCRKENDLRRHREKGLQDRRIRRTAMISRISLVVLLTLALMVPAAFTQQATLQKVGINYPARSGGSWPLFIAKEGGYYQKYGLDVELIFGAGNQGVAMLMGGNAVMTNSSMEQALQASSRDP